MKSPVVARATKTPVGLSERGIRAWIFATATAAAALASMAVPSSSLAAPVIKAFPNGSSSSGAREQTAQRVRIERLPARGSRFIQNGTAMHQAEDGTVFRATVEVAGPSMSCLIGFAKFEEAAAAAAAIEKAATVECKYSGFEIQGPNAFSTHDFAIVKSLE